MDWKEVLSSFAMQILLYLAPIIASLVAAWVFAKAKAAWNEFKQQQPTLVDYLEDFAEFAVLAAEQAGVGKLGEEKRKYAFDVIEKLLAAKGLVVDIDLIYAAIERAVLLEFNKDTGIITVE